jgi:S-sulfo-L-cysteine synthase (3-phospho-L-serine-dependent)
VTRRRSGLYVLIESNTTGTGPLFVRHARRLGLEPVLLARDPGRYSFADDESVTVRRLDTQDTDALVRECRELARRMPLAGVGSSSEYFVAQAAEVAARLGLPGADPAAVSACREKGRQRAALAAARLPVPRFEVVASADAAAAAARRLAGPVVIKPDVGSGSFGVRLCRSPEEALRHAGILLCTRENERGLPIPARVVVEEHVDGPELSAELVGDVLVGLTRKHLGPLPAFVETGHDYPADLDGETAETLGRLAVAAQTALGLARSPGHVELRLGKDGPVVVEANPRPAGGRIPDLVRLASGVDLVAAAVALSVGAEPDLRPARLRSAAIRFLVVPRAGRVAAVRGLNRAARVPDVEQVEVAASVGDVLTPHGDFRDRVGHVIACSEQLDDARAAAERAVRLLRLLVDEAA